MIRRTAAFLLAVLLFASTGLAQVPEFNVVPDTVDDDLSAYNKHDLEFTFSNQDANEDIFNLTLENKSYLSWDSNNFRLNASESRTVGAEFYSENVTTFNDTVGSTYRYNGSDNAFDGENISIELSTFYENTSVNVSALEKDFELEFGETDSSAFTVKNTGGEDAFGVELKAEDITFNRDDGFRIPAGGDVLVQYEVSIPKPEENATEASNQSYEREVSVSGANFNDTGFTEQVFVPFTQYDTEQAQESFADRFTDFCRDYPESNFCTGEQIVEYRNNTKVVNRTPVKQANISAETEEALQILAQTRSEDFNAIINRVNLLKNGFTSSIQSLNQSTSDKFDEVDEKFQENREDIQSVNASVSRLDEKVNEKFSDILLWVQIGVFGIFSWILSRGVRWLYENWEELSEDMRW